MSNVAIDRNGQPVLADKIPPSHWKILKATYSLEDFRMACCMSPAIPKTSSNGLAFFSHHDDDCATGAETRWHREAKALVVANLATLGFECREEVISESRAAAWRADTYFEVERRRIVIELQKSYQHLDDFLRRQQRYVDAGIENYWLLRHNNFLSLIRALRKLRLKREFGGKLSSQGMFPCIPELPVAYLETGDAPLVKGVNFLQISLADWLRAVVEVRFQWYDGSWIIG